MKIFFRLFVIIILSLTYLISPFMTKTIESAPFGVVQNVYTPTIENSSMPIAYTQRIVGVCFQVDTSYVPSGAGVWVRKYGTGGGDYTIGIKELTGAGGFPTGDFLTSTTLDGTALTTSYAFTTYNFDDSTILESGEWYALTIETTSVGDGTDYISWLADLDDPNPDVDNYDVYDTSPDSVWVTNTSGSAYSALGFAVYGLTGTPPLVATFEMSRVTETVLEGWAGSTDGNILETGFDYGTESGNYTDEVDDSGSALSLTSYYFQNSLTDLTFGETYYFRAKARNINGWGYGSEKSFVHSPVNINVSLSNIYTEQSDTSDNFTAAFAVYIEPDGASENVSARLSISPSFSSLIDLNLVSVGSGLWTFQTEDEITANNYILADSTTYYCQGWATTSDNISHYSKIKQFTTTAAVETTRPTVEIILVKDVSGLYNRDYVYEITCQYTSSNTTAYVVYYGLYYSEYATVAALIEPQQVLAYNEINGRYSLTLSFGETSWYEGQGLYFQAFVNTVKYGNILSPIFKFNLPHDTSGGDTTDDGTVIVPSKPEIITDFQTIISNVRYSLGLTGIMGTWAFMGLLLLIIALIFGVAALTAKDDRLRLMISIVWALISIAIVGAFIFSGELGIWPVIILVAATVFLVMTIIGLRLGSSSNG